LAIPALISSLSQPWTYPLATHRVGQKVGLRAYQQTVELINHILSMEHISYDDNRFSSTQRIHLFYGIRKYIAVSQDSTIDFYSEPRESSRVIAEAVSRRFPTAVARVRAQVR
jgi:hypothetical protein